MHTFIYSGSSVRTSVLKDMKLYSYDLTETSIKWAELSRYTHKSSSSQTLPAGSHVLLHWNFMLFHLDEWDEPPRSHFSVCSPERSSTEATSQRLMLKSWKTWKHSFCLFFHPVSQLLLSSFTLTHLCFCVKFVYTHIHWSFLYMSFHFICIFPDSSIHFL